MGNNLTFSDRILQVYKYIIYMDWQALNLLGKISKKKYIKKVVEYAIGLS